MSTSEELVKAINDEVEAAVIKRVAMRNGMKTLHQDSMLKVREGFDDHGGGAGHGATGHGGV